MNRIAQCCCGSLRVETQGEPAIISACHCTECQRRTGAPFGVSVYFPKDAVLTAGASKVYMRDGRENRKVRIHFCPECGSSVYWEADARNDMIGVALGAFADPTIPAPMRSEWETTRHPWVAFMHDGTIPHFEN